MNNVMYNLKRISLHELREKMSYLCDGERIVLRRCISENRALWKSVSITSISDITFNSMGVKTLVWLVGYIGTVPNHPMTILNELSSELELKNVLRKYHMEDDDGMYMIDVDLSGEKPVQRKSIEWSYFDKFEPILDKYMLPRGEGETIASQIVTAVNKLIYKWYNDGDTYDNTHNLEGWTGNDLSDYANWLFSHTDEKMTLKMIFIADTDEDYAEILAKLADALLDEKYLEPLSTLPKDGSIYDCSGPFKFKERYCCDDYEEDEEEEGDDDE